MPAALARYSAMSASRSNSSGEDPTARSDADTGLYGEREVVPGDLERRTQDLEDALGDDLRPHAEGGVLNEQDELVPTETPHRVAVPQHRGQPCGDRHEELVAHRMAQRVIDVLEVVEVEKHDGAGDPGAAGAGDHLFGPVEDQRSVRQLGERVVQGQEPKLARP